jgi:toxin ParE1/3/4
MAYEIRWAESAITSLVEAIEYIARDSPIYAATFAVEAERLAASLNMFPDRGRRVPEFNDLAVRELPVSSYRMFYRVATTYVTVLAFVHKSRDLAALIQQRPQ